MIDKRQQLEQLQARVSRGDRAAEGDLRRELEPWIALMVRRALRLPENGSPLEGLVQAEIGRWPAFAQSRHAAENPKVVGQIAQRVCATMIDRLRLDSGGFRDRRDTVCDWRSVCG
jgi:hypothetical protein